MPTKDSGSGQDKASRRSEEVNEVSQSGTAEETGDVQDRVGKLTDDVDDLLDEIDDVLESNAEEFVRGYVQKGGQ